MADEPKQDDPYVELANRGLHSPRGFDRLDWMPQLRGRRAAELYREMAEGDALIGAILFAIEMVLRQVEWSVEPGSEQGEEPTDFDIERADFLNSCKEDMSHTWEELISDALTMLPHGFAYLEIVYKTRETSDPGADAEKRSKFPDGRIGWRKFSLVPQATINEWDLDETGGVRAAIQGGQYGTARTPIPIEKALLFRTDRRSPQGTSVLRTVVEAWYHRKRLQEIEGVGAERDLAGLPVFTVSTEVLGNASRRAEYEKMIRNLRRDEQEGVVLPGVFDENNELKPQAKLELLSSGGSRQFDTNVLIQRYSREIATSLLQDVVLLGHEKVGTQALASEKRDLSDTALQAWLNDIAAILNAHAVPRLFALNGESLENLPQFVPAELRPTDVQEFTSALADAARAGVTFAGDGDVEAEIRQRLGLPPAMPEEQAARNGGKEPEMDVPDVPDVVSSNGGG